MKSRKEIFTKTLMAVIITAVIAVSAPAHQAQAQFPSASISVPTIDVLLNPKEYSLDKITNVLGAALIRTMSDSIQNWVRNGFDGEPLFVTDWEGFLREAGNEAFGIFVDNLIAKGAPDICSPLRSNVIAGLVSHSNPRARCTLDAFVSNINAIYDNFETYGWTGFMGITTANVSNNAFGSFLIQMDALTRAVVEKASGKKQEAQASRGFLSVKYCAEEEEQDEFGGSYCPNEKVGTPGSYVADSLGLPAQASAIKTAVADEFDELISVIAQELLDTILTGSGPRGFSSESARGPIDFFSALEGSRQYLIPILRFDLIEPETRYIEAKQKSANALIQTIKVLEELGRRSGVSRSLEINQNKSALERIQTEFDLADIKLVRYENILVDVQRTADPLEMNRLTQIITGLQSEARSVFEIETSETQAASIRIESNNLLEELAQTNIPQFLVFSAFPTFVRNGGSSLLSWSNINITNCSILGGTLVGPRQITSEERVFPIQTSAYLLECFGPAGISSATTTINVTR